MSTKVIEIITRLWKTFVKTAKIDAFRGKSEKESHMYGKYHANHYKSLYFSHTRFSNITGSETTQ